MTPFSFFFLLAWLLGAALATVPAHVYRADTRSPTAIKAAGGFKSRGTTEKTPPITVIEHASKVYSGTGHNVNQDPWVSTSSLATIAELPTVDKPCWVYTIDTSSIASSFTEVAAAYKAAGKTDTHPEEKEWAAKFSIPLSSITSFYRIDKDLKKYKVYTWETWATFVAEQAAKKAAASGSTAARDVISAPVAEEAGVSRAVAFQA